MKIRSGFVSNSSSSSFLVVFAKVANEKVQEITSKYSVLSDFWITNGKKLIEHFERNSDVSGTDIVIDCDWAGVYHTTPIKDIEPESMYVFFEYYGNEGDHAFMDGGYDWGEYIYDIDLDFFDDEIQTLYRDVQRENGFEQIFKRYGAGRNG